MNKDFFVENAHYCIQYWYGGDLNEDSGTVQFYIDGENHHEGIILTSLEPGPGKFRTSYWIPFDNIAEVSFR